MKKLYLLLLLLFPALQLAAQNAEQQEEYRKEVWGTKSKHFAVNEVPAEWNSENAVILSKKVDYEIRKRGFVKVLDEDYMLHARIKVLNNDGVKDYSELEFEIPRSDYDGMLVIGPNLDSKFFFGAKVVKGNGREVMLKETDLVKLELESGNNRYQKYKIAIPELEPGDVIDYYYKISVPRLVQRYFESPSFEFLIVSQYPILHQEYNVLLNKKCLLSANAYNGAPNFKLANQDKNFNHYQLIDTKRAKYKEERWTYDNLNMPLVKMKAHFVGNKKHVPFGSYPNYSSKLENTIARDEFKKFARYYAILSLSGKNDFRDLNKFISKHYKKEKDPVKLANAAYYFLRNSNMTAAYQYGMLENKEVWTQISDGYFVSVFSNFLKSKKINHEMVFTTNQSSGLTISDVMFKEDVRALIAVVGKDKSRTFYQAFTPYSTAADLETEMEGMPAFAVNMLESSKKTAVKEIKLPGTASTANQESKEYTVQLALDDVPGLVIKRKSSVSGLQKLQNQVQMVRGWGYIDACKKENMEVDLSLFCKNNFILLSNSDKKKHKKREAELRKEQAESYRKQYEESLQSEFSTKNISLTSLKVNHAGIWSEAAALSFEDEFRVSDMLQKVGPNYLLEVGKLIGGQVAIEENELDRAHNVQMGYAREFVNKIELQVPQGYMLEGIDKLNMRVENGSGLFVSTAVQQGDKLVITTRKAYLKASEAKENWKNMVSFLDAAYKFSQQKVLMKKKTSM